MHVQYTSCSSKCVHPESCLFKCVHWKSVHSNMFIGSRVEMNFDQMNVQCARPVHEHLLCMPWLYDIKCCLDCDIWICIFPLECLRRSNTRFDSCASSLLCGTWSTLGSTRFKTYHPKVWNCLALIGISGCPWPTTGRWILLEPISLRTQTWWIVQLWVKESWRSKPFLKDDGSNV